MSRPKTPHPEQLKYYDLNKLIKLVYSNSEENILHGKDIKNFKHYVYETVMEMFYGKDIWKWRADNIVSFE